MEDPDSVLIETRRGSDPICATGARNKSPSTLPTEWPPPDDAVTVRSISPLPLLFPREKSPNKGSADDHNIENEWKRLQTLRARIRTLRGNMERLGDRLRQIQDKQLEADNIYLSLVRRKHVAEEFLDEEIEHAFERLEASRFEYSEADAACESLREPLNAAELEQMRMEYRFYKNLEKLSRLTPGARMNWSSPSTTSVSSGHSSGNYGPLKTYHPLWDDYLYKLGVVERLEEEFAELENLKGELEDEKEVRRGIGKSLLSEDEEFLMRFPAEAGKLLASLQTARADVEKARVICVEAGVWRDGSSSDDESTSDDEYDAPSELSFGEMSSHHDSKITGTRESREEEKEVKKSITLEQVSKTQEQPGIASSRSPSQLLETTRSNSHDFSDGFLHYIWDKKTSAGNYVNLWLLHRLESSLIEFGLLFREAEPWRILAGDSFWQANVVSKWLDDGTSNIASATVTDPDSRSSTKLPTQHPFLNWDTKKQLYLPKTTSEAIGGSLLAAYFDSFVYSAHAQPKGLLFSTTEPPLQHLDFSNFFLLRNKGEQKPGADFKSEAQGKPPDMIFLGRLSFSFGTHEDDTRHRKIEALKGHVFQIRYIRRPEPNFHEASHY